MIDRRDFGLLVSERAGTVRRDLIRQWVLDRRPDVELLGEWSAEGQRALGREVRPVTYGDNVATIRRWQATMHFPTSGTGWATVHPWECFAAGTVCFFHPRYDDQDHILGNAPESLRSYLRVLTPDSLWTRVGEMQRSRPLREHVVRLQREHLVRRYHETHGGIRAVEEAALRRLEGVHHTGGRPVVGFAELGRVLQHGKTMPNPYEALRLLELLARAHPDWEIRVFSRTKGPRGDLPDNALWSGWGGLTYTGVLDHARWLLRDCNAAVVYVNQHMPVSLNHAVPRLRSSGLITTLEQGRRSCAPVIAALNDWTDADPRGNDPVYVCNDPRSLLDARDLKWPPRAPILAQYNFTTERRHFRFGNLKPATYYGYGEDRVAWDPDVPGHWRATHFYRASDFELVSLHPSLCPTPKEVLA